ncbi:MAG: hypothetical protein AUJ71_03680 [Candidatus Omnitrophica bacterium CG1_02_49_16]|nr:MAG: hypothetical protein AUJ71_03680 [Candidatus Omnitrophica bacterium CG1_02_49_16]
MKKLALVTMVFLMAIGIFGLQTGPVLAGEHGGSTMKTDSGSVLQGTKDDAATLKEAAALIKSSNPDLAKKLEKMAQAQCGI